MNYSRNLKRAAMAQRVIVLMIITACVSLLVGGVVGYAVKTHITAKERANEQDTVNSQGDGTMIVYGAYDDRVFNHEMSLDWGIGDLDFVPLDCAMPEDEQEFLFYVCAGYNIDFTLAMALIEKESSFEADAVSPTNDYGYMQINQVNHEWLTDTLGVTDYLDPYQNIRAGCFVLRKLFERYKDPELVLMAYHMGENGAASLWNHGVFHTEYTQDILKIQQQFNEQLSGGE